jgi:hypothetical protein
MIEAAPRTKLPSVRAQVVGSLLVAALIVAIAIAVVTTKIGPGPDAREYRDRQERIEEQREEERELQEEQQDAG